MEQGRQVAVEPMTIGQAGQPDYQAHDHDNQVKETDVEKYPALPAAWAQAIRRDALQDPCIKRDDQSLDASKTPYGTAPLCHASKGGRNGSP